MFKALRRLAKLLERPEVGAIGIYESLQLKAGSRSRWTEVIFGSVKYLLIATVALIIFLPLPDKAFLEVKGLKVVLAVCRRSPL